MKNKKAYKCKLPFEGYGWIVKYAETASKARYQTLLSAYDAGFMKRDLNIIDIEVRRAPLLDGYDREFKNMSYGEARRKISNEILST